jgi:dTDP-4-dehydrorhamnose reductase
VSRRVLVTGSSGFLGQHLLGELRRRGLRPIRAGRRDADASLDLEDADSIRLALEETQPDLVLHAAALSQLSTCESQPDLAHAVNERGSRILAEAARGHIVLVSTDLVFDGRHAPYRAADPTSPLSVYAHSKAAAEESVLGAGGLVVRVPLLFGRSFDGRRGATDMIRSARGRLGLFTNEHRTPLHVADAARGIVEQLLAGTGPATIHVTGPERVSRFDLAERFLAAGGSTPARLEPALCTDPRRPPDVSLLGEWHCGRSLDAALSES